MTLKILLPTATQGLSIAPIISKLPIWVLLSVICHAQITPRHILGKKYNEEAVRQVLIARDSWRPFPTTPTQWQAATPDSILQRIVQSAEKWIDFPFGTISATVSLDFVRSGDRQRHAKIHTPKRDALLQLILAESIEDKGRFMETILNGVWSLCEESYWGVPAHIGVTGLPDVQNPVVDLFGAETAALLAMTDYFVGKKLDQINPLVRKRIYYETNHRLLQPMLGNTDGYKWMSKTQPVNNWNPWIMSNLMTATLFLEKDETRRAHLLHQAMLGLDLYLNGLGEEGGCDEGPGYWFAAGGCVYDCLELLGSATSQKINVFDEPFLQKVASYVYKMHIGDKNFVNFADADAARLPEGLMLYRFGKALKDDNLMQMGQWAFEKYPKECLSLESTRRIRRVQNLLTVKDIPRLKGTYQPARQSWIADVQAMTARTANGLFLAAHGGHNAESHNHNDVGDFVIYLHGKPMIMDAGRGTYTARTFSPRRYEIWFTRSDHHNLPIVNGLEQQAGREFEAKNVKCSLTDAAATLSMDIAQAYPKEAGINTWNRTLTLNHPKNQIELTDDYSLTSKPTSLQQVLMTICEVDTTQKGKIKLKGIDSTQITVRYDPKLWVISTDTPSMKGMEYESFQTKWGGRVITRIILTNKAIKQKAKHGFIFEVP